jgi:hypothetical protein
VYLWGLAIILSRGIESGEIARTVFNTLLQYGRSVLTNLGLLLIIFTGIERIWGGKTNSEEKEWDPFSLPPVKNPNRINRSDKVWGILWSLFLISVFNEFPNGFESLDFIGDGQGNIPLMAPEFALFIPWITAAWSLNIILKRVVLSQDRWTYPTRWVEFAIGLFNLVIIYQILMGGSISTVSFLTIVVRVILWFVLVFGSLESIGQLYNLSFKRPFASFSTFKSKIA